MEARWPFQTIIEPFRIKAVEPIPILSREQRARALARAGYNLFKLAASDVTIDLLTDSGTGAMSTDQWAALMIGDESYAGSRSFRRLEAVVHRMTGIPHVFPVHQGRAAERIVGEVMLGPDQIVPNNTHFDTTRAHVEHAGARAVDLPTPAALRPEAEHPFKGDVDLEALERLLDAHPGQVPLVLVTLTNNSMGGQPVSLANLRQVASLCRSRGIPLFLDAARFAENAWFIQAREPGMAERSLRDIVRAIFDLADGYTMSAKKDGMVNIGGLLGCRDPELAERFRTALILGEGFPTYGGLAGRDVEALAVGLEEAMDPAYQRYRAQSVRYFAEALVAAGLPVVMPPGGHAVYIDAGRLCPQIPARYFPGQAVAVALYEEGGVRGCEIGALLHADSPLQLLRLALPRRTYTQAHVDYVVEVAARVAARARELPGYRIVRAPRWLRHFSAELAPVGTPVGAPA